MIIYKTCPVCKSENIRELFAAEDYTVSHEKFSVSECLNCTHLFTQNIPAQNEMGKYYASENYISHSDTQTGIINRLYHLVRKKTLNGKLQLIQKETNKKTGNILDIGCGTGAFLNAMNIAGWESTGLEPDETARKKAQDLYNIYPQPSAEIFNLPPNRYDAITMWHVLEHVHELHEYVEQLKNLITEKGSIFIAVPNYTSHDAQHYGNAWAAFDVPRHLYHFSPASMKKLVEQHGLTIKKIKPMWFDSFYVSMLSEKYKNGKGNLLSAFFTGFISNIKTMKNKEKCSSLIYVVGKA
ncbi:MAG: class I SAM-dependent methyltransferase [Ferruginibacter sp.]|nr:class I SAM-dependent methyltransferase [Ferruginibacter sp.]